MVKIALITGCNSLLGLAIARTLLRNNFDIAAHYHCDHSRIDNLKKEFADRTIYMIQGELNQEGVKEILAKIEALDRPVGILINNAATVVKEVETRNLDWQTLTKAFEVNVFAPAILSAAIFQKMINTGGKIVNISSVGAKYGGGNTTLHYGTSKAALDAITINLAREGAPYNILVNSIRPGVINTDFHTKHTPKKDMIKRVNMNPLKRMAYPEEIAELVGFIVSDKGNYITGEIITIAGGD